MIQRPIVNGPQNSSKFAAFPRALWPRWTRSRTPNSIPLGSVTLPQTNTSCQPSLCEASGVIPCLKRVYGLIRKNVHVHLPAVRTGIGLTSWCRDPVPGGVQCNPGGHSARHPFAQSFSFSVTSTHGSAPGRQSQTGRSSSAKWSNSRTRPTS